MVFLAVMCGGESWTLTEHWRIDAWTVVPKKTLESHLDARRSNLSILREISAEYALEGLLLKLKLQYFDHPMWKAEKTLMLGKIEGSRRRGWQRMRWLDSITDWMDIIWTNSGRQCRTGESGVLQSMGSQKSGHDLATEQQQQNSYRRVSSLSFPWR